jgi:regulator of protease activity HflC (stomatin/prohibitin superfamily)
VILLLISKTYLNLDQWLIDGILCLLGLIFWVIFFAQFVLPVRHVDERLIVFSRLFDYIMRSHGPAIFVQNGKVIEREAESRRFGPGVILLDIASAAYLRVSGRFTRPVGPGVIFTRPGETVGGLVDLRPRRKTLGPRAQENPFDPQGSTEQPAAYEERLKRRGDTQALTRNNIEVTAQITVTFKISPLDSGSVMKFTYDPEAIRRAVASRYVDLSLPPDAENRWREWDELPTRLAADLWREYMARFELDQLFILHKGLKPGIETIREQIINRLTRMYVQKMDELGNLTEETAVSKEYVMLENRGISVIDVRIGNLAFPPAVEEYLRTQWRSSWLTEAKKQEEEINRKRKKVIEDARKQALLQFAEACSHYPGTMTDIRSGADLLGWIVGGLYVNIKKDDGWLGNMKDELTQLQDIVNWTREEQR